MAKNHSGRRRPVSDEPEHVSSPDSPPAASHPPAEDRVFVLPSPPTDEEKYWYLGGQKRWFLWAGTAAGALVLFLSARGREAEA